MTTLSRLVKALFFILLTAAPLSAGVVHEIETKNAKQTKVVSTVKISIEGTNLKMESTEKGRLETTIIFNSSTEEMLMVDHRHKNYTVMDKDSLSEVSDQISAAQKQMEELFANMPAEQRAMMEKMMKKGASALSGMPGNTQPKVKPVIKKTSKTKSINGHSTRQVIKLKKGVVSKEYWVTDWDDIEGGEESLEAFEAVQDFMSQLFETLSSPAQSGNPLTGMVQSIQGNFMDTLVDLGGFPVSTVDYDHGKPDTYSTLISSTKTELGKSAFKAPKGYKRKSMMGQ